MRVGNNMTMQQGFEAQPNIGGLGILPQQGYYQQGGVSSSLTAQLTPGRHVRADGVPVEDVRYGRDD
jgi:hypothetical protein